MKKPGPVVPHPKSSHPVADNARHSRARRRLLRSVAAGGAAVSVKALPEQWARPVLDVAMLPVHAQTTCQARSLDCALVNSSYDTNTVSGDYDLDGPSFSPSLPFDGGGTIDVSGFADARLSDPSCPAMGSTGFVDSLTLNFTAVVDPSCGPVTLDSDLDGPDSLWSPGSGGSQNGVLDPDNGSVTFNGLVVNFSPPATVNDPSSEDYAAILNVRIGAPGVSDCVIDINFSESFYCFE